VLNTGKHHIGRIGHETVNFLKIGTSPEGIAFMSLAAKVVTQVDKRNLEMAPTHRIETHNS
jgi:hypothetical protein